LLKFALLFEGVLGFWESAFKLESMGTRKGTGGSVVRREGEGGKWDWDAMRERNASLPKKDCAYLAARQG